MAGKDIIKMSIKELKRLQVVPGSHRKPDHTEDSGLDTGTFRGSLYIVS